MAITLAESKVGMADHVDQAIIDEFRRNSFLLDQLTFDNAVSPGTGGSTLTYGYVKLKTPSTAEFRAINGTYSNVEAKREQKSANLKIFGGNFKIDRVLINTAGAVDELNFQMQEKIKGATNLFHNAVINGNSSNNANEFDGLAKLLAGSSTEITESVDLSTSSNMDSNYKAFLDIVDEFISQFETKPDMLLMNSKMKTKMKGIARRAGYYTRSEDAFGRAVDEYDGIPMVDLGVFFNGSTSVDIIPVNGVTGTTVIYGICLGLDGFHGVSPKGDKIISAYLPDLSSPGTVKEGDVEMVAAVVLKKTRKAGVLKGIQIAPALGSLTISSSAGTGAGDTALTVTESKGSGNIYKYKVGTAAESVVYHQDVSAWTTWNGSSDITAATGKVLTLVEATSTGLAVKAGHVTVTAHA